jgi:Spy/CpxP family protein refolding chaperone
MTFRSVLISMFVVLAIAPAVVSQGRFPSEEEREKIRVRVGMTKDQQAQVEAIFNEERKLEGESRKKTGELYQQLQQNYDVYDNDKPAAAALRKEICKLYHDRIMIHANAQEKLRKVLTKDQFDKMTDMAREWHKKWMEQRGNRGPGRPGPGSGPGPNT